MSLLRKLLGREELPPGFAGSLDAEERVLATAQLSDGGHLVVTSAGMWLGERRVPWHLISKATWQSGTLVVVEATEQEDLGGVVLLADLPPKRLRLTDAGKVPQVVHERVTRSITSRHHRELPGGGAWFVQRKVPGGVVLQARPDPGTDTAALRSVAAGVAKALGGS